jgi:phosphate:Na+ symporter
VIVATTLLPFSGYIVRLIKKVVPGEEAAVVDIRSLRKKEILKLPELALRYAEGELKKVLKMTIHMLKCAEKALLNDDMAAAKEVIKTEPHIDRLRYFIDDFLNETSWIDATEEQLNQRMRIFYNTIDMERVGDLALNIAQYAKEKKKGNIPLSKQANAELRDMFKRVSDSYISAARAVMNANPVLASKAVMVEEEVDKLYWKYRANHILRLQAGTCDPRAEEIFTNSLRDLERISDHADNLADSILLHFRVPDLE